MKPIVFDLSELSIPDDSNKELLEAKHVFINHNFLGLLNAQDILQDSVEEELDEDR